MNFPDPIDFFLSERRRGAPGCYGCNKGYIPVELHFDQKYICMKNPNLFLDSGMKTDENSIDNCRLYKNTTEIKCKECMDGYVLSSDFIECLENMKLFKCLIAEDFTNCQVCSSGYYLNTSSKNCIKGNIWGCNSYTNENTCSGCVDNYILDSNKCYELPEINCAEFDQTSKTITCNKCKSFYYNHDVFTYKICLPFVKPIDKCLNYDLVTHLCADCEEGYFIDVTGRNCIQREDITNCEIYLENLNYCSKCVTNFRLSIDFKQCKPNPTGLRNCEHYKSTTECKFCEPNYYLEDNVCVAVPHQDIRSFCTHYHKEGDVI